MELLLVLIGDFVVELAAVALVPVAAFLFFLAEVALEVICGVRGLPSLLRARPSPATIVRWTRWAGRIFLGITALLGIVILLLNTVFFESTLRRGLKHAREQSGIDVQFESARGSFLTGEVTLRNVTLRRQDSLKSNLDLKIKEVKVDASMASLITSAPRLHTLRLSGLEGTYQRGRAMSPRKEFVIDVFSVENATLELREPDDEKPAPSIPLTIDRLECRPLRKDSALFDLLFRSNGEGTLAGARFEIRTENVEQGRKTAWKAEGIPVSFLASYVEEPFDWLTGGTVDVDVDDRWSDGDSAKIDSHWKVTFRDVTAAVPPRITGVRRAVAEPVTRFIQAHPGRLPLEFQLKLEKGHFTGAASVETTGLLQAAADGLLHELARWAEVPAEKIKEFGRRTLERFRNYVEERRKKRAED